MMRMNKLFLLAAAAVAAISCVKENLPTANENQTPEVELVPMTFTASYETDAQSTQNPQNAASTRVAYEDGATVWKVGDEIMVISAETGNAEPFTAVSVSEDGKNATFEGLNEAAETYYAVYPASAYKGEPTDVTTGKKLYVNVAQTQQAINGTFDPDAIFCTSSNKGNEFNFKQACAFLKFQFDNPADIKKVHLKVNGSVNVAGIGYLGVNETDNPEHRGASTDPKLTTYDMITLNAPEGGFVEGEDYFIAMRANSCPSGVTFYIEYDDCVKSRTTENRVFPAQDPDDATKPYGSKGKIRNLGQLDKNLGDVTPYDAYQLGADLVVAGKSYSPADLGTATLVSESTTISANGVYFIAEGVDVTLSPANGHYLSLYIVSNQLNGRPKLNITDNIRWTKDGVICLKGMNLIDASDSKTLFQSNALDGSLFIDNCSIPTPKVSQLIYASHTIKEITIYDSDIKIIADSKYLINGNKQTISICHIENNIIYSPQNDIATFKFITNTPTIGTLNFNRNTIANVFASTTSNEDYFKVSSIETFNCFNNLFYLPSYSDVRYLYITKVIPESLKQSDNFLHKTASTNSRMRVIYEGEGDSKYDVWVITKKFASDVVTSVDLATGVIVPATSTGAAR